MSSRKNVTDLVGAASSMPGVDSAELYADTSAQVCQRSLNDLFSDVCQMDSESNNTILDIGCGTGEVTTSLLHRFDNVDHITGIDMSPVFIDYANSVNEEEHITYQRLNAESEWPSVWDNKFTVVFSNYVWHWIKDHNQLLANVSRCMKSNGDLIVQFFHSPLQTDDEMLAAKKAAQECGVQQEMKTAIMTIKKQMPIWKDMTAYSKLLTSMGFTVKTCSVRERHFSCKSRFERAGMTATVSPFMHHVPKDKRLLFATKYVSNLKDPFTIHHNAVVIHATKN